MTFRFLEYLREWPFGIRQRKLAASRKPISKERFIEIAVESGGCVDAAGLLWDMIQQWIQISDFTPYPDDDITYIYGLAEEDKDEDTILAILIQLNIPIPSQNQVFAFGRIDKLGDIARFCTYCREL